MRVLLLLGRVLPAIQLHDETVLETHKIDDEVTEWMLAAELKPGKLAITQVAPKQALRVCGSPT